MKRWFLVLALLGAASLSVRADTDDFSSGQLDHLDRLGYLTPAFKTAVHELVDAEQAQRDAAAEQERLKRSLPDLEKEAESEESKVAALKAELSHYSHPDETDFAELQNKMKDTTARPEEQMALAQAYLWTYPASPHAVEAQQDLEQVQKKMADQVQAQNDANAARTAAQARLLQRVKARSLSLEEWSVFLQDKTQAEVSQYLGQPTDGTFDYWNYAGAWTIDPVTKQKAGLHLTFNGGRVLSVSPVPAQ
jgi:peptidoglycan hydrolase CwlO-like protein